MNNQKIADILNQIADILEENDDNPYKIRAYRRAANYLKTYSVNVKDLAYSNTDLTTIPHIGKHLSEKINKIIHHGVADVLPKYKPAIPYPKKFKSFPPKRKRFQLHSIIPIVDKMIDKLKKITNVDYVLCTGDFRRKKEVIDHICILIMGTDIKNIFTKFHAFPAMKYIIKTTRTTTIVQLKNDLQITLYAVNKDSLVTKTIESTGSLAHYTRLQQIANNRNLRLTQNGIYHKRQKIKEITSEEEFYKYLNLQFIPPELRENTGEIEAATKMTIPNLIQLTDIKGDLHSHTNETDGLFSLETMATTAANKCKYEYLAITDHSQSLKITRGMDEKRLLAQIKQIDKLNEKFNHFTILKSIEVDILENGELDISNDVLKELDLTVCSVHSKFRLTLKKQTERIIRAMDNPYFNILGHATGRLILHRDPYLVDINRLFKAAKERNCFLELNAQPARLDINDIYCKKAKEIGIKIAISSDAHTTQGLQTFMVLGVNQARRGWLEAKDVLNTYSLSDLKKLLAR